MRGFWIAGAVLLAVGVAACEQQEQDPLAEARAACANAESEAEARIQGCTTLIDSGQLEGSDRAAALSNRGSARFEAGDTTEALRDFNSALQLNADNMQAVLGRVSILVASGQLDAAAPLTERLIASGEFQGEAHYFAGVIALQRGDAAAAVAAFDAAIAADPRHALALSERARAKQAQEDYAGALADYDAALRVNPQLAPALAGRCWTRLSLPDGDTAAARRDADAAVAADPRDMQAQLCRGLLQLRAGEWADAKASYDAVLEIQPGNPEALFGRGVARRRGGDGEGRRDMNQARDFSPNIARLFEQRGVETY